MTARWRRLLWWRAPDTTSEARAHLRRLEARDGQVESLGRELRETERRNHFSEMVRAAISRASEGGGDT